MSAAALIVVLQVVSLLGSALTAWKLLHTGLYRRYRFFFYYFLFRIPNTIWPLFPNSKTKLYFFFWVATGAGDSGLFHLDRGVRWNCIAWCSRNIKDCIR